jgi:hypothetical protein
MAAAFVSTGIGIGTLGFDAAATPPWVMVPQGGSKTVRLREGDGLTLRLRREIGIALPTIQERSSDPIFGRTIEISGQSPSTSFLEAVDARGLVRATLEINVKAKIVLTTSVFFVFEKNGRVCKAGLSTAETMIDVANKLYLPQANIALQKNNSGPVNLPFNLDQGMPVTLGVFSAPRAFFRSTPVGPLPCISSRVPDSRGCLPEESQGVLKTAEDFRQLRKFQITSNLLSNVSVNSNYNIFFIRFLDEPLTGAFTPSKLNGIAVNACFIPDKSAVGKVLGHELGHFMLRPNPSFLDPRGHSTTNGDLMVESPGPNDIKIPKDQAIFMNPSGNGIFKF